MAGDGNIGATICGEDLVEYLLRSDILIDARLSVECLPQLVVLREARLNSIARKRVMDVGFTTPVVACMAANTFTEQLFYFRDEGILGLQIETGKGEIRGLETPCQRTGIVALRPRDLLLLDLARPEMADCQRLVYT